MIASKFGMNVTMLCPSKEYYLDEKYIQAATDNCKKEGSEFNISHNIEKAYSEKDIVYAKSWGCLSSYGQPEIQMASNNTHKNFIVDSHKMSLTKSGVFSHCLPLRRNIKATDEVMDSDYCLAIKEAANRKHVQKSLLTKIL